MNRLAMITGAAGGLGSATARILRDDGWDLALVGRDEQRLEGSASALEMAAYSASGAPAQGPRWFPVVADVSTFAGSAEAVATCKKIYSAAPQALVHAAGSIAIKPLHLTREEEYRACLAANLDSAFFTLGAFVKGALEAKRPASAVLISSVAARIGVPRHDAVEKSLRAQYPLGRWGEAADVAHAVAWFISDRSEWMTGQVLAVDGGFSATRPLIRT